MGFDIGESAVPQIDPQTCTVCGLCAEVCGSRTLARGDGRIEIARRTFLGCIGCGQCMTICPTGAIRVTGRRVDVGDLVDLPPPGQRASADALDALLLSRRSVRRFAEQPVDRAAVERILAMTSTAPMGIPPSDIGVVVFHGRDKVRQFAADAVECFRRSRAFFNPVMLAVMRPFIGRAGYRMMRDFVRPLLDLIVACWEQGQDAFTYDAPLAVLFHRGPQADPADVHIAATYAMLAGQSLGLASCMLGTAVALDHARGFKAKHGIGRENCLGLAVAFGHAAASFPRGLRRKLASVRYA